MANYVYLFCKRDNLSGSVNEVAYSSYKKAMVEYTNIRDHLAGLPVNFVSQEDMISSHLPVRDMIDKLLNHCFVGPRGGNTWAYSYYIVKKIVF